MMLPVLEKLSEKYIGVVKFIKIDIDSNSKIPQEFNVTSIPTFIYFKDGIEVERNSGIVQAAKICEKIDTLI